MKFLRLAFYVMIAQLVLSGCADEGVEETSSSSSSEINFDAYLGRNASTRAGVTDIASLKGSGFGVFARYNHNGATSLLMDNEHVTWNVNRWGYTNTRYWPNEGSVDFYAFAPYLENVKPVNAPDSIKANPAYIEFTSSKSNVDLVWDVQKNKTVPTSPTDGKVTFQFKHALAKISFKILSDALDRDTVKGAQVILKSVKLHDDRDSTRGVFIDGGYLNLAKGTWVTENPLSPRKVYTWTSKTDTNKKEGFLLSSNTINYKDTSITVSNESYLFILPQMKYQSFYLVVDYVLKHADGIEEQRQAKGLVKVNPELPMNFVAGKAYNFVLNIPLDRIQVYVDPKVEGWTSSTTKKTRAAAEEEKGTNTGISEFTNGSKLGLFAFRAQNSTASDSLFMSKLNNTKVGEELTYRASGKTWNYSPKRFWPQTGILHFYAGYPYFMEFNEKGKFRFTTPDYNPFGVDFLWGTCNNVECSSHPDSVKIKMKHALARVNIYFKDYGNVDSVKVAASREGTFTPTSTESIPKWNVNRSQENDLIGVKKKIEDKAAILFVFPGKINKLRFRSSLKGTIDLPNFDTDSPEFKAGKEYNINVSPGRINYDYVPPK